MKVLFVIFFAACLSAVHAQNQVVVAQKENVAMDTCLNLKEIYLKWGHGIYGLQSVEKGGKRHPFFGSKTGKSSYFYLNYGERITAISGTRSLGNDPKIYTLRLHTNKKKSKVFGFLKGPEYFIQEIPEGQYFIGFRMKGDAYLEEIELLHARESSYDLVYKLATPTLIRPMNQVTLKPNCTDSFNKSKWTLKWNPVEGAVRYQVLIGDKDSDKTIVEDMVHNSYFSLKNRTQHFSSSVSYFWKVRAMKNKKWGNWSDSWTFVIDAETKDCYD